MKWLRLLVLLALLPLLWSTPVWADSSEDVTITATGYICEAPGGFTVTYINDYEVGLSWTKGEDAVNTMVRGTIGREPTDRTDGYLVYYGNEELATDWVNMETLSVPIYYKAWSEDDQGRWEEEGGTTGFVEGLNMILIALIALCLGLMVSGFWLRNQGLLLSASLAWFGLGWYSRLSVTMPDYLSTILWWVGLALCLLCGIYSYLTLQQRRREDLIRERRLEREFPTPPELSEEEQYSQELDRELGPIRKQATQSKARRRLDQYR